MMVRRGIDVNLIKGQCKAPCEKILPDKETNTYPNNEDNCNKFWWVKHGCYDESYSNNNPDKPWQDNGCGKKKDKGRGVPYPVVCL